MAELNIKLDIETKEASAKIKKLEADWERATQKVERQRQKIAELNKELEEHKKILENAGVGKYFGTKYDKAGTELIRKLKESNTELKRLEANASLAGIKLQEALSPKQNFGSSIANTMKNIGGTAFESIKKPFEGLGNIFNNIKDSISGVISRIGKLATYTFIFNVINKGFRDIRDLMSDFMSTNSAFSASLSQIRGNLLTAFQPIWETILPYLIQLVQWLSSATASISAFISGIFGKSEQSSRNSAKQMQAQIQASKEASKALNNQKKNTDKLANSTNKANKDLAKFDELNVITKKNKNKDTNAAAIGVGSTGVGATGVVPSGISFDTPKIDTSSIEEYIQKVKEFLSPISDAFKNLYPQIEKLGNFLAQVFGDFWETFLAPIVTFLAKTTIPDIINSISASLERMDLSKVADALHGLWEALEPLGEDALKGVVWILDKFLLPLSEWTITEVVPRFIDMLTNALNIMRPVLETAGEQLQKLYDNFLKPVGEWTGGIITEKLDEINDALVKVGKWLKDPKNKTALEWISAFIIGLGTVAIGAILVPALWSLVSATAAWTVALLANPITWVVAGIAALIAAIVMLIIHFDDIKAAVISAWNTFKDAVNSVWELLKGVFNNVWELLKDLPFVKYIFDQIDNIKHIFSGLIDFIAGVFTGDWDRAFKGLGNIVIGIVNSVISVINFALNHVKSIINGALGAINLLIKGINLIPGVSVPEIPYMDTSKDTIGKIPYLAHGAVIPPNSPFLAMLGDQTSGTNIEAPLETIKQAFIEALNENSGYNSNGNYTFVAQLDGRTIFEETVRQNDMYMNQAGRSAFAY